MYHCFRQLASACTRYNLALAYLVLTHTLRGCKVIALIRKLSAIMLHIYTFLLQIQKPLRKLAYF